MTGEGAKVAGPWALLQAVRFYGSGVKPPNLPFKKLPPKDIWTLTVGSTEVPQGLLGFQVRSILLYRSFDLYKTAIDFL